MVFYLQGKFKVSSQSTPKAYGKEIIVTIAFLQQRRRKPRENNALAKGIQIICDKFRELKPCFYDFEATTGFQGTWVA